VLDRIPESASELRKHGKPTPPAPVDPRRRIRTGKNTGLGHFPSHDYKINQAWLDASMIACVLLSWLKFLALDGDLARAEPKTLRYRVLHAAARLVRGGRRRTLKIAATWPWAQQIITAWQRIQAIPYPT
jgi:hypothetical protein